MRSRDFFVLAANQVKFAPCVLGAILSVLCVTNAKASPVTYTESATVSGSLNGVSFSNDLLTLTGTGDTTNITKLSGASVNSPVTALFTLSVSVAGVGSGTLTGPFEVFDVQSPADSVGFIPIGGPDLLDTMNAVFASYDLSTSIGPITGSSFINPPHSFSTNVGALDITSAGDATFTAVVTPLPATLPLFAIGLGALGLLGWRRKRKGASLN
jgi:hypothetical protein